MKNFKNHLIITLSNNKISINRLISFILAFTIICTLVGVAPIHAVNNDINEALTDNESGELISVEDENNDTLSSELEISEEIDISSEEINNEIINSEETDNSNSNEMEVEEATNSVTSDRDLEKKQEDTFEEDDCQLNNTCDEETLIDNELEQQENFISFQPMAMNISNPYFTYTGQFDLVEYATGKYYVRLLTNGTFTPKVNLKADAFLVGGGGGGGSSSSSTSAPGGGGGNGGHTSTIRSVTINSENGQNVIIGAGGGSGTVGGITQFGPYSASGGGTLLNNVHGGSGGGQGAANSTSTRAAGNGGSNGSHGYTSCSSDYACSSTLLSSGGQGTTTLAFGGDKAPFNTMLFAGGGGGGGSGLNLDGKITQTPGIGGAGGGGNGGKGHFSESIYPKPEAGGNGATNTGGGGGGGGGGYKSNDNTKYTKQGGTGGSGIVILRWEKLAPTAPTSLAVSANPIIHSTDYIVSWPAAVAGSDPVNSYYLERSINGAAYTQIYTGMNLNFTDNLTRNQANTVIYRVRASSYNASSGTMYSDYRTSSTITVTNNRAPSVSSAFSISPANNIVYKYLNDTFYLTWDTGTDIDDDAVISILEVAINGGSYTQLYSGSDTSFEYQMPANLTKIQFRIRSKDDYSNDATSYSAYITTELINISYNTPPSDVTGLTGPSLHNSYDNNQIIWNWDASIDTESDTIYYTVEKSVNGGAWTQVQDTTATNYTHSINIPNDNVVQIRIMARDYDTKSAITYSSTVSVTHDTTAPTLELSISPDSSNPWYKGDGILTVFMADGQSGLVSLSGPTSLIDTGTVSLSGLTATKTYIVREPGDYSFTAKDKMNNLITKSISVNNVDNRLPTITYITSLPLDKYTNQDIDVTLTIKDELSGLSEYTNPDGTEDISGFNITKNYTITQSGVYSFGVNDIAGNNVFVDIIANMIDKIKPVSYINAQVNNWTNAVTVDLDVGAVDDYSGVNNITLPNGSIVASDKSVYTISNNGIYKTSSEDNASNISNEYEFNYNWFDRTKPTITNVAFNKAHKGLLKSLFSLFTKEISNEPLEIAVSWDDTPTGTEGRSNVESLYYRVLNLDGMPTTEWTLTPIDIKPVIDYEVDGSIEVAVIDHAGNYSNIETYDIMIDLTYPTVTVAYSTTDITNQPVTATFTGFDELNGSGWKGFILPQGNVLIPANTFEWVFEANDSFVIKGVDNAGNETILKAEVINIEKEPPIVTGIVLKGTDGSKGKDDYKFMADVAVEIQTANNVKVKEIQYNLSSSMDINNDEWTKIAADGKFIISDKTNGFIHTRAISYGNNISEIVSTPIIMDKSIPEILGFTYSSNGNTFELDNKIYTSDDLEIEVNATDDLGIEFIQYALSTKPNDSNLTWITVNNNKIELTLERDGYLYLKAIDYVGNESAVTTNPYVLDKMDPLMTKITITEAGNKLINTIMQAFNIYKEEIKIVPEAKDNLKVSRFEYVISSNGINESTVWNEMTGSSITVSADVVGIVYMRAIDSVGRISDIEERNLIIDTVKPTITVIQETRENEYATVILNIRAFDDGSGVDFITLPNGDIIKADYATYSIDYNGSYTIKVIDKAGNEYAEVVDITNITPLSFEDWENNYPVMDTILNATNKTNIHNVTYRDIQKIVYLDLSSKGLSTIPQVIKYAKSLEYLDLKGNEFEDIPEFIYDLSKLKYLDISNNNLTSISDNVSNLTKLESFDVSLNYLVNYECLKTIKICKNEGNFTSNNQVNQYSFNVIPEGIDKHYIGNIIKFTTEWTYNNETIDNLEAHRKELYTKHYGNYKTYRPLIYSYSIDNGHIDYETPDYTIVELPNSGSASIKLKIGPDSMLLGTISLKNFFIGAVNLLETISKSIDILELPVPEIKSIDAVSGIVVIDTANVDNEIEANLNVYVKLVNKDGELLDEAEVKVNSEHVRVSLQNGIDIGNIVIAQYINKGQIGSETSKTNSSDGKIKSPSGDGTGSSEVIYVINEVPVTKEIVIEKLVEAGDNVYVDSDGKIVYYDSEGTGSNTDKLDSEETSSMSESSTIENETTPIYNSRPIIYDGTNEESSEYVVLEDGNILFKNGLIVSPDGTIVYDTNKTSEHNILNILKVFKNTYYIPLIIVFLLLFTILILKNKKSHDK